MTGELRYFVASSGFAGSLTDEDARDTIWDQMSRDIRTLTVEGFGATKGASEKSIPQSNPENSHSLPPGSSNPPPVPNQQPTAPSPTPTPY
jgi:hypothetical protein